VSLVRLTPLITNTDLGWLRLSQDDLAHIVRLVGSLEDAEVVIKSSGYQLTDVRVDLPKLGKRVTNFEIKGSRAADSRGKSPCILVELTTKRSQIITEDPDLPMLGLVEALRGFAEQRGRMPAWLIPFFRSGGRTGLRLALSQILTAGAFVGLLIALFGFFDHHNGDHLRTSIVTFALVLVMAGLLSLIGIGWIRARSIVYTATSAETPTFWEQYRADIAIHVIVGAAFFALGLLVGRL
jgi:hypothetical protein